MRIGQEEMVPSYYTRAPYTIEVYSDVWVPGKTHRRKTIAEALAFADIVFGSPHCFCVVIFNQYGFEVYRDQKW